MLYSPILSIFRILLLIFWVVVCLTVHFVNAFIFKRDFFTFYNIFFKGLVSIFGIKVKTSGKIDNKNILYVANHISYLDVFILGAFVKGIFVAKSEIKNWPLINKIAALGRTIFVNRSKILSIKEQVKILENFDPSFDLNDLPPQSNYELKGFHFTAKLKETLEMQFSSPKPNFP